MPKRVTLDVDGTEVVVSNLDKVLYPKVGFTKAHVIGYYADIAPWLLPHLRERPITLKRYPNGVEGGHFYEKRCPAHRPEFIETTRTPKRNGDVIDYCVLSDLPSLIWAANLADLELHTFLHRGVSQDRPDSLTFDLDPGEPATVLDCCQVALWLRELFEQLGLEVLVKTSGSKGLQVNVPLNAEIGYDETKSFAHAVALHLEREHPKQVVSKMQKALRRGKVLIDWSQNDAHKTTINAYSLRANSEPTVSTPITWEELARAHRRRDSARLTFGAKEVLSRVRERGDPWATLLTTKQTLPNFR